VWRQVFPWCPAEVSARISNSLAVRVSGRDRPCPRRPGRPLPKYSPQARAMPGRPLSCCRNCRPDARCCGSRNAWRFSRAGVAIPLEWPAATLSMSRRAMPGPPYGPWKRGCDARPWARSSANCGAIPPRSTLPRPGGWPSRPNGMEWPHGFSGWKDGQTLAGPGCAGAWDRRQARTISSTPEPPECPRGTPSCSGRADSRLGDGR